MRNKTTLFMQEGIIALQQFFIHLAQIDDTAWQDIRQCLKHRSYKKKDHFVTEGKVCKDIAFTVTGSFRYFTMIDGVELTTFFSFEGNWVSAYSSFITQASASITIEAMDNAELLVISYDDLQRLYNRHTCMQKFGRLMAEYLVNCLEERMLSLLLKTPEERYLKTLKDNGNYFDRVPQHYIASYLGVAPESLSRIRKRVMQRHFS